MNKANVTPMKFIIILFILYHSNFHSAVLYFKIIIIMIINTVISKVILFFLSKYNSGLRGIEGGMIISKKKASKMAAP